jgi:hypothetical protein
MSALMRYPLSFSATDFGSGIFAGDLSVVGRTLRVNSKLATVIGVAASEFSGVGVGVGEPAFWAPITL